MAGAGQGNARCAECHLMTFSPNVTPSTAMGGSVRFTKTATGGSCTLTCHGKDHQGVRYSNG